MFLIVYNFILLFYTVLASKFHFSEMILLILSHVEISMVIGIVGYLATLSSKLTFKLFKYHGYGGGGLVATY